MSPRPLPLLTLMLPAVLSCWNPLGAAEITLEDGQVLRGEVVEKSGDFVILDVQVDGGQARVKLPATRIANIKDETGEEVTEEAFDRLDDISGRSASNSTYSLIKITGTVGKQIRAEAIDKALVLARRLSIKHVVFDVDSAGPADLDEAGKLNEVLAKHRRSLQLHVILRKAVGAAILFPLHSHSNHLTKGAVIGGNPPAADEDDEIKTLRTDIAYQIGAIAEANGKPEEIFRAFVNPTETVAVWKEGDERKVGAFLPDGISPDNVLLENDAKSILTLKADNFANAKLVEKPADLGDLLAISGWAAGSEGPQKTYTSTRETLEKRAARNELNTQRRIDRVVQRRLKAARTMEHAIEQAKEWDPNKGNYATVQTWVSNYGGRWRRGRINGRTHYRPHRVGGWYDNGGGHKRDTKRFTTDSRREWQIRSRNTTRYLSDALQAAKSLKSLDRQAVKLGLEPMYEVAELDNLIKELTRTQQAVAQQFGRKGK